MNTTTVFTDIYNNNFWGSTESRSGEGSELKNTLYLRTALPALLSKLEIKSILDIPCGDYKWMQYVDLSNITYIGADIVPELIYNNKLQHAGMDFRVLDITSDSLPQTDVIFCRDCFVHLSYSLIESAITNIIKTDFKYILLTTFIGDRYNIDINTDGNWRPLNFEKPPFSLPKPVEILDERCTEGEGNYTDKSIGVWTLEQFNQR